MLPSKCKYLSRMLRELLALLLTQESQILDSENAQSLHVLNTNFASQGDKPKNRYARNKFNQNHERKWYVDTFVVMG